MRYVLTPVNHDAASVCNRMSKTSVKTLGLDIQTSLISTIFINDQFWTLQLQCYLPDNIQINYLAWLVSVVPSAPTIFLRMTRRAHLGASTEHNLFECEPTHDMTYKLSY